MKKNEKIKNGNNKFILSVRKWIWQKSSYMDYRVTNRGGKGIISIVNSERNEM